jgi:hypothetical protein
MMAQREHFDAVEVAVTGKTFARHGVSLGAVGAIADAAILVLFQHRNLPSNFAGHATIR